MFSAETLAIVAVQMAALALSLVLVLLVGCGLVGWLWSVEAVDAVPAR